MIASERERDDQSAYADANRAIAEALEVQRALHTAGDLDELRAQAAMASCAFCGFDRAVVLAVEDDLLTANGLAVEDAACDVLRRRALAAPTSLLPGSDEAELVRRAADGRRSIVRAATLTRQLGLEHHVVAAIVPEARCVALLVVDRVGPPVREVERVRAEVFAGLIGVALERGVLRARLAELSSEFRHLATSGLAMGQEALVAPVTFSTDLGWGSFFPPADTRGDAPPRPGADADAVRALLSPREAEVVALLAAGRSNREIAEALHLSPDTVKSHVAKLLRKLGAANRAEAVSRYLGLRSDV